MVVRILSIVTLLSAQGLPAQAGGVLAGVKARLSEHTRRGRLPAARPLAELLGELATLESAAEKDREQACRFLAGMLRRKLIDDRAARWRLTCVRLVSQLAEKERWVAEVLRACRRPGRGTLRGLDHWVERALGGFRTRMQVERLLDVALDERHQAESRLALGALAHLEDANLLDAVLARLDVLAKLARGDDAERRARAVLLLGRLKSPGALPPLLEAAMAESVIVRLAAARALGNQLARPAAAQLLGRLLADPAARVREEAAVAFRKDVGTKRVPLLVERMQGEPLRQRFELGDTLEVMTGFSFGPDAAAWKGWLASQEGLPRHRRPGTEPVRGYGVRYHGIPVRSDRVLFVLDVSGSMAFEVGENSLEPDRIDTARAELLKVLQALDARTSFNVLFFNQGLGPWRKGGLQRASKENVKDATRFVRRQRAIGGTNTFGALQRAFHGFPSVDTVFFLSDGVPSVGRTIIPERILQQVWQWNRLRGVRIHSIALTAGRLLDPFKRAREDPREAEFLMRSLAELTGGSFVVAR